MTRNLELLMKAGYTEREASALLLEMREPHQPTNRAWAEALVKRAKGSPAKGNR